MTDNTSTCAIATALRSAVLLRSFTESRHIYGDIPDETTSLELHQLLLTQLDFWLDGIDLPLVEWKTDRPHFENTKDTTNLSKLIALLFMQLSSTLGHTDDPETVKEFASKNALPPIPQIEERLQEILVFGCRFPLARAGAAYISRERAIFALGHYWEFYRSLLERHGSAGVCLSPHPLLRFIADAKSRIEHYLSIIDDQPLKAALSEALEIAFDVDTLDMWEQWALPIVARASESHERIRLQAKPGTFSLTGAERLFLESGYLQLKMLDGRLAEEKRRLLDPPHLPQVASEPETCFDWIRRVEQTLRDLILNEARARVSSRWPDEVVRLVGVDATAARTTMQQRGVTAEEELIHYTQLSSLNDVIVSNFSLYAQRLGIKRRQFNTLMAPILKGRTEEAHNRPVHLWPKIEQDRTSLACHDLLRAIKNAADQSPPTSAGAS